MNPLIERAMRHPDILRAFAIGIVDGYNDTDILEVSEIWSDLSEESSELMFGKKVLDEEECEDSHDIEYIALYPSLVCHMILKVRNLMYHAISNGKLV